MQRIGRVMRLREGKYQEYRELHEVVWPEVLDALRDAHIENYTIYYHAGLVFSTMEYTGEDFAADRETLLDDPAMIRWNALTGPCLEPVDGPAGQPWPIMEELFHLD